MKSHEYALVGGFNRARLGRYVQLLAASVSAAIVFVLLYLVDIAKHYGINANLPPTALSLVGATTVFALLYWIFDKYGWKWRILNLLIKVPDVSGTWECVGQSHGSEKGQAWRSTVTITQSWDKIRIYSATGKSASHSVSAALICDDASGCRVFYNYRNDPGIDQIDMSSHVGFCELTFAPDLKSASGEYFNGRGRYTFGTMELRRV